MKSCRQEPLDRTFIFLETSSSYESWTELHICVNLLTLLTCTTILSNNNNTVLTSKIKKESLSFYFSPSLFLSLFPVLPCKQTVWREPSASLLKVIICRHLDLGCLVSRTLRNGYLLCEHPIQDSLFKQSVWLRYYFNKINTIVLPYPHLYFAHLWLPTVTCSLKRLNVKFQRKQSMYLQLHSILSGAMK